MNKIFKYPPNEILPSVFFLALLQLNRLSNKENGSISSTTQVRVLFSLSKVQQLLASC